jgi:hypothetical protein
MGVLLWYGLRNVGETITMGIDGFWRCVLQGPEADDLTSVARQEEGVEFYMTSDEDVAALFGLEKETRPALVLLKNVPDKRLVFSECETFKSLAF